MTPCEERFAHPAPSFRRRGRSGARPDEGRGEGRRHGAPSRPARSALLVATTVIEVGVDVPDATIMVIEHAERFGLAQLHQLRGRVGRGSRSLDLHPALQGTAGRKRPRRGLSILRETEDGFRIAEEDLKLRGEGELLGTRQSGTPGFAYRQPRSPWRPAGDRPQGCRLHH